MIRSKLTLAAASALAMSLAAPALAQDAPQSDSEILVTAHAAVGDFGVDLTGRDTSVKPGDDFERYANGAWIDRTTIDPDRTRTGAYYDMREDIDAKMHGLITALPADNKAHALFHAFMDTKQIERVGLAPLMKDIAEVRAIADKTAMAHYMGRTDGSFGSSLFNTYSDVDPDNPKINTLNITQGGLGLPERDYYLNPHFAPQRAAYVAYMQRTFKAIGTPDPAKAAADVMAFETYIAQLSWPIADRRDIDKTNNPYSFDQLAAYAPEFDWAALFDGIGLPPQQRMIVNENSAVQRIAKLFAATPLETLKAWEEFHVADQASPYLTKRMVDSRFAFIKALSGATVNRDRWKRGVTLVNGSLGELVGQDYVAKYFPPAAKAQMEKLVANLKLAMADRIKANSWMSEPTKLAALAKLDNTKVMIGYPDKWRDYSALGMSPTDLYGDVVKAGRFNAAWANGFVGKPVDRSIWQMSPQTVNAYNAGQMNEIVFPAAYLQAPNFDPAADPAVNYGAIGATIGHEISHSFDDQGRKIDATGAVRDWWTPEDAARFDKEAKAFGEQYAAFEVLPGAFVNPDLTMGENIADLAGLTVALDAYHRSLNGKEAPVIDGLTGDQRFFLGYAQTWRTKAREDSLRNQMASDPHAPDRTRVIVPPRNIDAWYAAFDVKPGDAMYIPPEQRAHIW